MIQRYRWFVFIGALAIIAAGLFFYIVDLSPATSPTAKDEEKTITFSVFFSQKNVSQNDCSAVLPVKRTVPYTTGVARAALEQLFAGPTTDEIQQGYSSALTATSSPLINIAVEDGTAYIDLQDIRKNQSQISSSCGSSAFLAQITNTLTQFSSIQHIIFAINENPQTFYDWIQAGCSLENEYCDPSYFLIATKNDSSWTTYVDPQKSFSISYPHVFTKSKNTTTLSGLTSSGATLTYRIPTKHCALSGVCTPTTANIQLQLNSVSATYDEVVKAIASSTGQSPESFTLGNITGSTSSMGVEGEGLYEYAIPLTKTKTLLITRTYIDEATVISYRTAPLFISFDNQKKIFEEILRTLKVF